MAERPGRGWPEPATKNVTAPDGSIVHYANLPRVGDVRQHNDPAPRDAWPQPHPSQAARETISSASPESLRERLANAARAAAERAGGLANSAFRVLIKDDVDKLVGAHSTPLQRAEGAVNLASWAIPEGKVAEIAAHAIAKAAESAAAHGAEHVAATAAEHATRATAVVAPWNRSDILARPLTAAERHGEFKSADDLKAFLGRAGDGRDWHHIVESAESQFGPNRVHNPNNLGAIERDPTHRDISQRYQRNDPLLPPGPDGRAQSLRSLLKGKPWEEHVAVGERELRVRGIDPQQLRAETRERFEQRLAEHDRRLASHGHAAPSVHPGIVPMAGRAEPAAARHDGPLHILRDGEDRTVGRGYQQPGTILAADGDTIVQNIGRGRTATYSRDELLSRANPADRQAFDAALQPGNNVEVRLGQSGLSMQQNVPGLGWTPVSANAPGPSQALQLGVGGR